MKKCILIYFLMLVCCKVGFAENDLSKNELVQQLASTQRGDTTRLNTLLLLIQGTHEVPQEQVNYIDQLLKEAEEQKNNYYKCQAYLYHMFQATNRFDASETNKWMKLLEPLARKEKLYDLLFRGKECVITILLLQEQYERQEKEAMSMLKEAKELNNVIGQISAYHCLSHVYLKTYRGQQAFAVLEKAIQTIPPGTNEHLYSQILRTMTLVCEGRGDLPNWGKYLKMRDSIIDQLKKKYPSEAHDGDRLLNDISYLYYYIKCEALDQAAQMMQRINLNYSDEYELVYRYNYRAARNYYYHSTKDWHKALVETDEILKLLKPTSKVDYVNTLVSKAKILNLVGKSKEALDHFKQAKELKDSLSISTLTKQTEQLKNSYKADLQLLDKEQQQQQTQQIFLILAVIIILILTASTVHANKIKRKLIKAEKEMRDMMNETEQANKIKERFLANINTTIRPPLEIIVTNSARLASDEKIDDWEKEQLSSQITTTSNQLMELINEILILSKLEAKMMKFSIKEIEIIQLLKDTIEIANQEKAGKVCAKIFDNQEFKVNGDENHLKQVIHSLCKEAVATDKEIFVQIEKTEEQLLKITFNNTALAMPNPSQENIIHNEINKMMMESFEGKYDIDLNIPNITLTFYISSQIQN